jgi:sugar/nucleoside kinase (ribokinase family)
VVLCGTLVADVRVRPFRPVRRTAASSLHHVDEIALAAGGLVSNTGLALARLGVPTAAVGRLGADGIGDVIHAELLAGGLQTETIRLRHDAPTSSVIVCVDERGERTFHVAPGANAQFDPSDIEAAMPVLRSARVIALGYLSELPCLDPHIPDVLARLKRETGAAFLVETAGPQRDARALLDACLPAVDIFFPSWREAQDLTGRRSPRAALDDLARVPGPAVLGIKLGSDGCLVRDASGIRRVPAYPTTVVDATGAGDVFLAGYLAAHLRGLDTLTACKVGNLAASLAIGAPRGAAQLPPLDTLLERIEGTPRPGQACNLVR